MRIKKWLFLIPLFVTYVSHADDWGGGIGKIEKFWFYGDTVIVLHDSPAYSGTANCANNSKFSFNLSDFSAEEQRARIFSWLLAANASKASFRPLFHSAECGPENAKKFIGKFEMM